MSAAKSSLKPPRSLKRHELAKALTNLKGSKDPSFELFPTEIRLQIYRELLLTDEELDPSEPPQLPLYPAILMCNKNIHEEAAGVLYGENCFAFGLYGRYYLRIWRVSIQMDKEEPAILPRHYTQLMTKVHLHLDLRGDDSTPGFDGADDAAAFLRKNVRHAAVTLTLNNLSLLKISYHNAFTGGPANMFRQMLGWGDCFSKRPFYGENCLRPLVKIRATRVEIVGDHVGPKMSAKLKATIEGPKDAAFLATRKQIGEADENEFEGFESDEDEFECFEIDEDRFDDVSEPEGDEGRSRLRVW